jgi:hypothetical protein
MVERTPRLISSYSLSIRVLSKRGKAATWKLATTGLSRAAIPAVSPFPDHRVLETPSHKTLHPTTPAVSGTDDFRRQATLIDLAAASDVTPGMFFSTQSSKALA